MGISSINYQVADLNSFALPVNTYDAIFAESALHHLSSLEDVFQRLRRALRPGGLLICNEYIGPARFQFPPEQVSAMNAALALLPLDYRRIHESSPAGSLGTPAPGRGWFIHSAGRANRALRRGLEKLGDGSLWPAVRRKTREALFRRFWSPDHARYKLEIACASVRDVVDLDPSEAVRSDEIVALMQRDFKILEMKGYGGSILQFLLGGISQNFASPGSQSKALLQMLFDIEDGLIGSGVLRNDFAVIVAQSR
jgi:SAM-dependent methyltransferase